MSDTPIYDRLAAEHNFVLDEENANATPDETSETEPLSEEVEVIDPDSDFEVIDSE